MRQILIPDLLWLFIRGSGLLTGVFFFSAFVMAALGRIDHTAGIAAMNSVNTVIVRSLFMPVFLGSTLTAAASGVLALFRWGEPAATAKLAGGVIHKLGMFVVTMVFNVRLNNVLAAVDPTSAQAGDLWARFLRDWRFWNHVRTMA